MSIACDETADRVRQLIDHRPGVTERRMFGGICFMLNGNMLCCSTKAGELMVRVAPDQYDSALARPGAEPMTMGERTMSGFILVTPDAVEDEDALRDWMALCEPYVRSLPPKDPSAKSRTKPAKR